MALSKLTDEELAAARAMTVIEARLARQSGAGDEADRLDEQVRALSNEASRRAAGGEVL